MNNPKPEHRISNLEKEFVQLGTRIEELSSDTAEELKAVRQDIKQLNDGMMDSFKELGNYFELTEKAMATKDDISRLETTMATKDDIKAMATKDDISRLETTMATKDDIKAMATKDDIARLEGLIMQLMQQKSGE